MKFNALLVQGERKNVVGIDVPEDIIDALGAGKRPPVKVTLNGYTYRSTVAVMSGKYRIGVAAEHRQKAGVKGGDRLDIEIELDSSPREVAIPDDFAAALRQAGALAGFEALAFSHRREHVRAIEEAKAPETRKRRIEKAVAMVVAAKA